MIKRVFVALFALSFFPHAAVASPDAVAESAMADVSRASVVTVSYHLRYDEGDAPYGGGWSYTCPNCGQLHRTSDLSSVVEEERTADRVGFLISPTEVVTSDSLIPLRFIDRIEVRAHGQTVPAEITAVGVDEQAVRLSLEKPLTDVRPLPLTPASSAPAFAMTRTKSNGTWTTTIHAVSPNLVVRDTGETVRSTPESCLLFDKGGRAMGLSFNGEIAAEGWNGDPTAWAWMSHDDLAAMLADVEATAARQVLHATLRFRSPTKDFADEYAVYMDDQESELERHVPAVVVDRDLLLLPVNLEKDHTARLEQIRIRTAEGGTIDGTFAGSLKDYGAFLVRVELPSDHGPRLKDVDLRGLRHALVPAIELRLHGEQEKRRPVSNRMTSFEHGFRDQVFPQLGGPEEGVLVFSREGELLAFPMARRTGPSNDESWYSEEVHLTPVAHLRAIIEAPDAHLDPSNIPLSEEQENRVAWLGTETQSLDADLARAMGIADKTGDGMTGLMVTYVYEGSPATRSGLEVGDVLLRIHTREEPRPIELAHESYYVFDLQPFPWDQLDEIPEEYFDQLPPPWPPGNGYLNKLLTDLGAGNDFSLEYLHDGDLRHLDMVVEYSPPYFRTASKVEHEELGITVRDMTYEVRRCLQRTAADPGVIISTLAPGSRASVSGLRPYELITHVDDEPVMNVADFTRLASDRGEVRLAVRRLNSDRIVSITLEE